MGQTLSVIIPVYNEEATLRPLLEKVFRQKLPPGIKKEVIIVNDGSTDKTAAILQSLPRPKKISLKILAHTKNQGKTAAIKTGLKQARGKIILIQDADLELDPADYPRLIRPILAKKTKVVYGNRWAKVNRWKNPLFYLGSWTLTFLANRLYGAKVADLHCGYKAFDTAVLKSIKIKTKRFEFCPEVTVKLAKKKIKITSVPIRYQPRTRKEGKKIKYTDGLAALKIILQYRFDWEKLLAIFILLWTGLIMVKYLLLCWRWRS